MTTSDATARLGVYINDSFEANDAIAQAQRLIQERRWTAAAELLQRTADTYADSLSPASDGVFISIRETISKIIGHWPAEGLEAYRSLYEAPARSAVAEVDSTVSPDDDVAVLDRYFATAAALDLADRIGQSAIERGELLSARRVYGHVLRDHPDAGSRRDYLVAMIAIIDALRGMDPQPLSDAERETMVRWMGGLVSVGSLLDGRLTPIQRVVHSDDHWPMDGGGPDRNRLSRTRVEELGLLWSYEHRPRSSPSGGLPDHPPSDDVGTEQGGPWLTPVVDGDFVFVQADREVIALHRRTGARAWDFRSGDTAEAQDYSDEDEDSRIARSVTVSDHRVFAAIPGDAGSPGVSIGSRPAPELVCLDGATGALLWRADSRMMPQVLADVTFDPSPVVVDDRVFVIGRRRRPFGFEDCYVFRFSASDGTLDWRTHVGSASTSAVRLRGTSTGHLAYRSDSIYVVSNLGTMASLSTMTGRVQWLRLYERDLALTGQDHLWRDSSPVPWLVSGPLLAGEYVVAGPADADSVMVLTSDTGSLVRRIKWSEWGDGPAVLLGVADDVLCGAGRSLGCRRIDSDQTLWSQTIPDNVSLRGQGARMDDALFIASNRGLHRYSVNDGRQAEHPWDISGGGGDLVVLPEEIFVGRSGRVSAYVRKDELWNSLRSRMAESPSDPVPALEFAEIAMRGGDHVESLEALGEVSRRTERFSGPLEPELRRRIYDDILNFADTLETRGALTVERAESLYSFITHCPSNAEHQVRYRFRFAALFERFQRADQAVRLCHQIIIDRGLRDTPWSAGKAGTRGTAGVQAQRLIGELIDRHGVAVYRPLEMEAQRLLESGQRSGDEAVLEEVVESFPNSRAAPEAMIVLSDSMMNDHRYGDAARVLSQTYHTYSDSIDRPDVLRRITEAYRKAGRPGPAYRWMTKAMREFPTTLIDLSGHVGLFREHRDRLGDIGRSTAPVRPGLTLPLGRPDGTVLEPGGAVLVPWFPEHALAVSYRYFLYEPGFLRAVSSRTHEVLWSMPLTTPACPQLLIAGEQFAVMASPRQLFGVDLAKGSVAWVHEGWGKRPGEEPQDWEQGGAFRMHDLQDDLLLSATDDGRLSVVSFSSGKTLWSRQPELRPLSPVRLAEPYVLYHVIEDDQVRLVILNAQTGEPAGTLTTDETRPVAEILVALDGQILLVTAQSVASFDPDALVRRWRISLDGQIRPGALLLSAEALYLSDDGSTVRKFALDTGDSVWRSPMVGGPDALDLTIERFEDYTVASTSAAVTTLRDDDGSVLWRGTTPVPARFVERRLTNRWLVALNRPDDAGETMSSMLFYDLRDGSGVIAPEGGMLELGRLTDFRSLLVTNDGVLIQNGSTLLHWSSP